MRSEFCKRVELLAADFAATLWDGVVESAGSERADEWMKKHGGGFLRCALGQALTARSERLRKTDDAGVCSCGGAMTYRQRKSMELHTVLPGRDVEGRAWYAQCEECHVGAFPLLREMKADPEGFTLGLRELSLLAGVVEAYQPAQEILLQRFAGVDVSRDKIHQLVFLQGKNATGYLKEVAPAMEPSAPGRPIYLGMDGGMVFVDKRWQEVKLGCLFREEDRAEPSKDRGELLRRHVVAVRGTPEELWALVEPRVAVRGDQLFVVLGDGAAWIWNLAGFLPNRVEILDWYHADEHISELARTLYGEGTEKAAQFRDVQLTRLADDGVDDVISALQFLLPHQRSKAKKSAVEELLGYLDRNRTRMLYKTFKSRGFHIGSGCVESAISHVFQQRMKRVGMRWHQAGADAMLALRSIYRTHEAWDPFIAWSSMAA
jgi:hypothetical protein